MTVSFLFIKYSERSKRLLITNFVKFDHLRIALSPPEINPITTLVSTPYDDVPSDESTIINISLVPAYLFLDSFLYLGLFHLLKCLYGIRLLEELLNRFYLC